nr:lysylphosphatidylglycerol synthase domain-containing protein [Georgenia muralis]
MARVVAVLRSPWVRRGFVVLALAAAVWAVAVQWTEVREAAVRLGVGTLVVALLVGLVFVVLTMLSWRAVLTDMGSRLPVRSAASLFFVSQVAKYLPGGVWNILAAAEMGADHAIPRRRSISVMAVSLLVSVVTGSALALAAIAIAPGEGAATYGWIGWTFPVFLLLLAPPVLNQVLSLALRAVRRPPLEKPVSASGVAMSAGWSLLSWLTAGALVSLLAVPLGMEPGLATYAIAAGGYALAWTVGFLVLVVPAGVGVREAVLAAVLATQLTTGAVVLVVLLSRVLLTAADLILGAVGLLLARRGVVNTEETGSTAQP